MKKYAPWVLIPAIFGLLIWAQENTRSLPDFSEPTFFVPDDAELAFYNLRQLRYHRENREDAGMRIFRHRKWSELTNGPDIRLAIIVSPPTDRAYIKAEAIGDWQGDTLAVVWSHPTQDTTGVWKLGAESMSSHFRFVGNLFTAITQEYELQGVTPDGVSFPIFRESESRKAFDATMDDYLALVGLR